MNTIPLVSVKKGQLFDGKEGAAIPLEELFKRMKKDTVLYLLDYDGIERNNPNFDLYQQLTEHCILWIDNGPRRIDDVMDTIMAGATNITLRENLWPNLDLLGVQELTDDEIFLEMSPQYHEMKTLHVPSAGEIGIVLFNDETMYERVSKEIMVKQKVFLYTSSTEKISYWSEQGVSGIIMDLQKNQGMP
jgi:hypothetical protein